MHARSSSFVKFPEDSKLPGGSIYHSPRSMPRITSTWHDIVAPALALKRASRTHYRCSTMDQLHNLRRQYFRPLHILCYTEYLIEFDINSGSACINKRPKKTLTLQNYNFKLMIWQYLIYNAEHLI